MASFMPQNSRSQSRRCGRGRYAHDFHPIVPASPKRRSISISANSQKLSRLQQVPTASSYHRCPNWRDNSSAVRSSPLLFGMPRSLGAEDVRLFEEELPGASTDTRIQGNGTGDHFGSGAFVGYWQVLAAPAVSAWASWIGLRVFRNQRVGRAPAHAFLGADPSRPDDVNGPSLVAKEPAGRSVYTSLRPRSQPGCISAVRRQGPEGLLQERAGAGNLPGQAFLIFQAFLHEAGAGTVAGAETGMVSTTPFRLLPAIDSLTQEKRHENGQTHRDSNSTQGAHPAPRRRRCAPSKEAP